MPSQFPTEGPVQSRPERTTLGSNVFPCQSSTRTLTLLREQISVALPIIHLNSLNAF
jgi:hypothetical protein